MSSTNEFRRFPRNTWRLVKLRKRYIDLRYNEDLCDNDPVIRMSKSEYDLRHHLIENFSKLDVTDSSADSILSVPSLTSTNSSPSSLISTQFNTQSTTKLTAISELEK